MNYTGAINHISLSCSDVIKSRAFYHFFLVDLMGYKQVLEASYGISYARKTGEKIFISPGNTTPHHKCNPGLHHLAFSVGTHDEIDKFHKKIVSFYASHPELGHILDAPALYPEYGPHYYAVFFTDPDGIKLELAFSKDL
ncbi:hypothetical protein BGZ59_004791 [Podila verticillata]|nr:hypothetical protein BGZ59_004791 [Podila verticillata]KFH68507.1 hypothetical protein MVEG_05321 [Podila verticillata NRRL 6337]